jgi:DNA mismatch repair protein MutS2
VSLKTVGLLVVMAQSGLHVPAQSGSEIPFVHAADADIGDVLSSEQSLSTFSGHITNIVHILKEADADSLVILDELGAGTDPQEGAAIARAILAHLIERGVATFVATHYPELKTFAHGAPGVVNASLEFDVQTLRPTYRLTIGLPGRSNALLIAQRLGLNAAIIDAARENQPRRSTGHKLWTISQDATDRRVHKAGEAPPYGERPTSWNRNFRRSRIGASLAAPA